MCSNSFHSWEKEYPAPRGARVARPIQRRSTTRLPKQFASASVRPRWSRRGTRLAFPSCIPRLTRRSSKSESTMAHRTFVRGAFRRQAVPIRTVCRPEPARGGAGGRPARCARSVSRHLSVVQVEPDVQLATDPEPGASTRGPAPSSRRIALGSRSSAAHAPDSCPATSLPAP